MTDFEKNVKNINILLEKGDRASIEEAEKKAKKLRIEVQSAECLDRDAKIAEAEVILGVCQTFLGKFDAALKNLESALRKHASLDILDLNYWNMAFKMFGICKERTNVLPFAQSIIISFREFRNNVRIGLGE